MSKVYKLQRIGGSIYLCIPPSFFSAQMLEDGVVKVELIEKVERESLIRLSELDEHGEHAESIEAGGKDTQELRAANNVRKVN